VACHIIFAIAGMVMPIVIIISDGFGSTRSSMTRQFN
jgi:hypothetical protein